MVGSGSSTTTYQMKLYCKRMDWLVETKKVFNEVECFYYKLLLKHPEFWEQSNQMTLRSLEICSIPSRDGTLPSEPLPMERVPLYFRRAAINAAVAAVHSYLTALVNYREKRERFESEGKEVSFKEPAAASQLHSSPLFYKGMYKDLENGSITLKLYTGGSWAWVRCKYAGRALPKQCEMMSPTVVLCKGRAALHIPIKQGNGDARTGKERMAAKENVCGLTFTSTDAFVVCSAHTADGRAIASRFIRGGNQYVHHSKRLLEMIKLNCAQMGKNQSKKSLNLKHWKKLNHLSEYYAHKVSREIIRFCNENQVKMISVTKLPETIMKYVVFHKGKYSPMYLGLRIGRYLQYKAWQNGIIITEVRANYTANKCNKCRAYLIKQPSAVRSFRCKGGHAGNKNLNTSKNMALMALKKFGNCQ